MVSPCYKENFWKGEREEKNNKKKKKQTEGLPERLADLWVNQDKALVVSQPVTDESLRQLEITRKNGGPKSSVRMWNHRKRICPSSNTRQKLVLRSHIHEYGHVRNRHVMFITTEHIKNRNLKNT